MPAHSDHSAAQAALAPEDNFNAQGPQGSLSAAQLARQCSRGPWPIGAADVGLSALQLAGRLQEVRSCSVPLIPSFHNVAHESGYGISLDDVFDDRSPVGSIGA